jgi:hypothetical protein
LKVNEARPMEERPQRRSFRRYWQDKLNLYFYFYFLYFFIFKKIKEEEVEA